MFCTYLIKKLHKIFLDFQNIQIHLEFFFNHTWRSDQFFLTFYLNSSSKFFKICSQSGMNAVILLLDVNSWLLWLIPHHHSGLWAEDFVRIRTPTGPNNGSAEWRRGKRRGGPSKCKFTLSVSTHRETLQERKDRCFSPNGKCSSGNSAGEDGCRCAVGGFTCRKQPAEVRSRFIFTC